MRPRKEPSKRLDFCAFRLLPYKKQLLQAYAEATDADFSDLVRGAIDKLIADNQTVFDQIAARLPKAPANCHEGESQTD